MKFDTRNRKPKVYSLIGITAAAAMLIFLLRQSGLSDHLKWINLTLTLYFLSAVVILFDAFQKQLEYNPYSYNTIIYSGFGLYLLSLVMTHSYLTIKMMQDPEAYSEHEMILLLLNSAKNYLVLISPLLLIFSGALVISNLKLIRIDRRRTPMNYLAMGLAAAIVIGAALILYADHALNTAGNQSVWTNLLLNFAASVYLYFECMMTGTIIADVVVTRYHPDPDKDFLIILGAGLEKDGTPTLLLQKRIMTAIDFYREQIRATGKTARFIVSGGQGADEVQSEAAAMKSWMTARGIPENLILTEDRSVNTYQNMSYSKEIINSLQPDAKIAFSTSDFHVFRAGLKARRVKMRALGMAAPSRWYFWPNASVREFIGLLSGHRMKQFFVLAGIGASYILLTVLAYR